MRAPTILLATGSTGGHVAPALAIAEALAELAPHARLSFAGPSDGIARAMVERAGGTFEPVDVAPLRGAGAARLLRGAVALPASLIEASRLLGRIRPDLVIGTGGHTSGPLLAAAASQRRSTLLFEANVEPGLANAWLGPLVDAAALAWPGVNPFGARGFVSGCPVRRAIAAVGDAARAAPERTGLLVLGGSGASGALDRAVIAGAAALASLAPGLSVAHQASAPELERVQAAYRGAGIEARVETFFPDIATEYARATVVVARAGGITLGEIAAAGLPSVVVPFPAAGDHQRTNAAEWARLGCGVALQAEELTGSALVDALRPLLTDPERREAHRRAILAVHRPEAAREIAARGIRLVARGAESCASPS